MQVQFGDALEAACRTLLDTHAATLAVVDQNLVEAVRPIEANDARFRTHEVAVVAGIARSAAETTIGLLDGLLLAIRLNDLVLRLAPTRRRKQGLGAGREMRKGGQVQPIEVGIPVEGK